MNDRATQMLMDQGLKTISYDLHKEIYDELPGKVRDRRRWIWELMQNAKDAIQDQGNIEIQLIDDEVTFAHNGAAFTYENLAAILGQTTSKAPDYTDDEKNDFFQKILESPDELASEKIKRFLETTGRFGSGFMTTYLLSKEIRLDSVYTDGTRNKNFNLSLDRNVVLKDDLIPKVRASFEEFAAIEIFSQGQEIDIPENDYQCRTKFTYKFDSKNSKEVAKEGINDLHQSLGMVFAFVGKLNMVKIMDNDTITIYQRLKPSPIGPVNIVRVLKTTTGLNPEILEYATVASRFDAVSIAIPVTENKSTGAYILKGPQLNLPMQFVSFPLIGSEKLSFPVIVNSPLFNPRDAREKITLTLSNNPEYDKKVNLNRAIYDETIKLFKILVNTMASNNWENLHYLAKIAVPEDVDTEWYIENVQDKITAIILNTKMVYTEKGQKQITPSSALFPIYKPEKLIEFWKLCAPLIGERIPREQDAEFWREIITVNKDYWGNHEFSFGLTQLLEKIKEKKKMETLIADHFPSATDNPWDYLDKVISFVEIEDKELLDRVESPYKIIPSLDQSFQEKKQLSRDKGWPSKQIPMELISVLKSMGDDWNKKIVNPKTSVFVSDRIRSVKTASDKVKTKTEKYLQKVNIPKIEDSEFDHFENYKKAMFELISIENGKYEEQKMLHLFASKLFPEEVAIELIQINEAEEFDWTSCHHWVLKMCLEKTAEFETMDGLCKHLFNAPYPVTSEIKLSEDEETKRFQTDKFLNNLLNFSQNFLNNKFHILENYAVVPNQNNKFNIYSLDLYNDTYNKTEFNNLKNFEPKIPTTLKNILLDFNYDCRDYLLHEGISLKMPDSRDTRYLCSEADKLVMENTDKDDPIIKNAIRELEKWVSGSFSSEWEREDIFSRFYKKRHSIVLNTYSKQERNQVDQILKSGKTEVLAQIATSVKSEAAISQLTQLAENNKLESTLEVFAKYPDITQERMAHLLRLEELSKGLKTHQDYTSDEQQKVQNYINGYRGEAYIYHELKSKGYNVDWPNRTDLVQDISIIDHLGNTHYIKETGQPYDLVVHYESGRKAWIQVKATTTDIQRASEIAMPISLLEWNYLGGTSSEDAFYLARVFEVSENPQSYYLKIDESI